MNTGLDQVVIKGIEGFMFDKQGTTSVRQTRACKKQSFSLTISTM